MAKNDTKLDALLNPEDGSPADDAAIMRYLGALNKDALLNAAEILLGSYLAWKANSDEWMKLADELLASNGKESK